MTPGSSEPQRVPIGRPSTAVKPIVLATLRAGLERAHARAVAEVQHDGAAARRAARRAAAAPRRCTRRTGRGSRSAARPRSCSSAGSANICASSGCVRWNAVSKQATCGSSAAARAAARIGARLCGWCSGASGTSFSSARHHVGVRRAPAARSRMPAVHDAMADAGEPVARAVLLAQKVDDVLERAVVAELRALVPALLADDARRPRPSRRSAARV